MKDMKEIKLFPTVGSFAENKDSARRIRLEKIIPEIEAGKKVVLDFQGIESTTQSFIHALISDIIRKYGPEVLDILFFKNCEGTVKGIINIVVQYMQESE